MNESNNRDHPCNVAIAVENRMIVCHLQLTEKQQNYNKTTTRKTLSRTRNDGKHSVPRRMEKMNKDRRRQQ